MELLEKFAKCFALCSMKVTYQKMTKVKREETIVYVNKRINHLTEDRKLQEVWIEFGDWICEQELGDN